MRFLLSFPAFIYNKNRLRKRSQQSQNCIFKFLAFSLTKEIEMASQTSYHARSNSLPSTSHPIVEQFDQHFYRLRSSQATSTSSSSLSHRLSGLLDLYTCIDELLQLPLNQQTLSKTHGKWVEEVLDGSLRLLDICGTSRDVLLQSKERMAGAKSQSRKSSWFVVAKLIHKEEAVAPTSEFDCVDATLESLTLFIGSLCPPIASKL